MSTKSVLQEAREVQLAITLIGLGARLQFLEAEVNLSRERLLRLYKEIKGVSPPKGQLPFSVDWYMTWLANIHASMFYNIYAVHGRALRRQQARDMIGAYRMYQEQVEAHEDTLVLDFTRAYTLVRFFDSDMLQLTICTRCTGQFVSHAYDNKSRLCVRAVPAAVACRQDPSQALHGAGRRRRREAGACVHRRPAVVHACSRARLQTEWRARARNRKCCFCWVTWWSQERCSAATP